MNGRKQQLARRQETSSVREKLQKARRDGQVARSRDLGHALLLAGTLSCLIVFVGELSNHGRLLIHTGLRFDASHIMSVNVVADRLGEISAIGLKIFFPIGLAGLLASIIASLTPGGFNLTTKPLIPKWERLNPQKGIKRLVSRNHLVDSVKLASLVAALTIIGGWFVTSRFDQFAHLIKLPLIKALSEGWEIVSIGATALIALLILVAMIDVPMQWFRNRTELKMTLQEFRDEHRETDGDPHLRARIRARQREIGSVRMMASVPTADVIISNPTHYSVALRYEEGTDSAPRVVAKGVDEIALRIRELGRASDIPHLEAPALARALYAHVKIDQEVPASLYNAVAQVLAYIFQLRQATASGTGARLQAPTNLTVPPGLDPATTDTPPAGAG